MMQRLCAMSCVNKVSVKLTGEENYEVWRFQLNILLKSVGIYNVVKKAKPVNTRNADFELWLKNDIEA